MATTSSSSNRTLHELCELCYLKILQKNYANRSFTLKLLLLPHMCSMLVAAYILYYLHSSHMFFISYVDNNRVPWPVNCCVKLSTQEYLNSYIFCSSLHLGFKTRWWKAACLFYYFLPCDVLWILCTSFDTLNHILLSRNDTEVDRQDFHHMMLLGLVAVTLTKPSTVAEKWQASVATSNSILQVFLIIRKYYSHCSYLKSWEMFKMMFLCLQTLLGQMFKMIQQMLGFEIFYTMYHCQI